MFHSASYKINSVDSPPADTPTEIAFNPVHDILACTSWDSTFRFYNASTPPHTMKTIFTAEKPLLSCCFSQAGTHAFAGAADGKLLVVDLQSGSSFTLGAHERGVRSTRFSNGVLITGSWDRSVRLWDLRSSTPIHTLSLPERVLCMDAEQDLLALCLSGNKVLSYDLRSLGEQRTHPTKLNWQVRSIACFSDNDTFIVGGIEGRAEVIGVKSAAKRLIFKCHRTLSDLHAVNGVSPHPLNGDILATCGGDGYVSIFDRSSKMKVFHEKMGGCVSTGRFSRDGSLYGFGVGYDWSQGYMGSNEGVSVKVLQMRSTNVKW